MMNKYRRTKIQHILVLFTVLIFSLLACSNRLGNIKAEGPTPDSSLTMDTNEESSILSSKSKRFSPKRLPVNRPVQITFESDPVLYADISPDGKQLVYFSARQESSGLWLRSADPARVVLPKRLTSEAGVQSAPAFSRDGRLVVFVGNGYDVKGDIYLMDLNSPDALPRRLTGRDSEDGAPCFSPDGRSIYFHQARAGEGRRHLAVMDLDNPTLPPRMLDTSGDGSFPALSPDGKELAFVSVRDDPNGDIYLFHMETGSITPLTRGTPRDLFPVWSEDGRYVYFSRFAIDTDRDGAVTPKDHALIYRVNVHSPQPSAFPVTSASYSAHQPMISKSKLYFLSNRKGVSNLWALPREGEIPDRETADKQMALARDLESELPLDHYLTVLAYNSILERFPGNSVLGAKAAYAIGKLYELMEMPEMAERTFRYASESFEGHIREAALSGIHVIGIKTLRGWRSAYTDKERQAALKEGLSHLQAFRTSHGGKPEIEAASRIEQARMLSEMGRDSQSLLKAISMLDRVIKEGSVPRARVAEAMVLRADLYSRVGRTESLFPSYSKVITEFGDLPEWADRAVSRILELSVSGADSDDPEDKIRLLSRVIEKYGKSLPILAMGAWNRIGDIHFSNDQWGQAKEAYRQVLGQFPAIATQTAAARLALAEILYREERFHQALDLYETEMVSRPYEDYLYRLARTAHIKKSIAAGRFLFRLGEVLPAQNIFMTLLGEDYSIIEAHRGYIRSAAARKQIPTVLAQYRQELRRSPNDPIALYGTGLCLTYREDIVSLKEARSLLERAIEHQGQVEYFHQTLGYVFEVLETVHKEKGLLEAALESYQKAYFLNDPKDNPENSANLLLNLGNVHFLLGQYGKAFERYSKRAESGIPFDNEDTELLFYYRFGAAAFQVREREQPVHAYSKALDLIEKRIQPKRASEVMGRMNRFISDRIITPALRRPEFEEKAREMAGLQGKLSRRLYEIGNRPVGVPPRQSWRDYRSIMESLITEQEGLIRNITPLILGDREETLQSLEYMVVKARDALGFPLRLLSLKAEMLDRLGLSFQEAGKWREARETFERTYTLNEQLGQFTNLVVNQRAIAHNTYMEAGTHYGKERKELVHRALDGFKKVKDLVRRYGVAKKGTDQRKKAVISLALDIDLNKTGSSQATYGFSAEQEERLAEAFISRIQIELGRLDQSREALTHQLARYPPEGPLSEKDLYGVSLLYHRAGHLDYALRDPLKAFDYFRRSTRLSHQLENPVSAAINVRNMAAALAQISPENMDEGLYSRQLLTLDRKTTRLLKRFSAGLERDVIPSYHNAMGVLSLKISQKKFAKSLEQSSGKIKATARAGMHFSMGLTVLEKYGKINNRKLLALAAALHLNMAELAFSWEEASKAADHLESALRAARQGLLPEYEWRALAGLGRHGEALKALESVSVLIADSGPGEITGLFAPLVDDLLSAGKTEEAFNLAERLSEIERVHRLAPLVITNLSNDERRLLRRIYPRLLTMQDLRRRIAVAKGAAKDDLEERLEQEGKILGQSIGEKGEQLPSLVLMAGTEEMRDRLMILLGLAVHIEEIATGSVKRGEVKRVGQYIELLAQYREALEEARASMGKEDAPGIMGILVADPVEAIDLMENLLDKTQCTRLFPLPGPEKGWVAFRVTADEIRSYRLDAGSLHDLSREGPHLLVYDDPSSLPIEINGPIALSATHLVRSIRNRKPFKRTTLTIPGPYSLPKPFESRSLPTDSTEEDILDLLPEAHTLFLKGAVYRAGSVPTRPGQRGLEFMALDLGSGLILPMIKLSDRLSNASLAVLLGASLEEAYPLGHLYSLFGVSTLLLPRRPLGKSEFLEAFFREYAASSVEDAVRKARSERVVAEGWIQLGFRGMTPKEARVFAKQSFSQYVRMGIKAFKLGNPRRALRLFENALYVARETEALGRYLPDLYRYARESAYGTDRLDKAVHHARALVDLLARKRPDSEAHAKALLKLGLVEARIERYEKAVPALEEAVDIMAGLEIGPDQAAALSDLGVVLENATEYDRALIQFRSAAELSKALNKKDLLARQYVSIGRIYDLRLSMYMRARKSYGEAYSIYQDLGQKGGMARTLLDMGRCYRLLGNFREADEHYRKALDLIKQDMSRIRLKAKILMEQANNAWYQARYQEAFDLRKEVYDLARSQEWPLEQVIALNTSGLIWWSLGDHERALRELEKALVMARTLKVRQDEVATSLNNMGLVYREMGRFQEALEALEKALAIDRKINSRWAIAYDLRNMAQTYVRMGEPKRALPLLEEALSMVKSIGNRINEAKILLGLGEALTILGQQARARDVYTQALKLAMSMALRETEWRSLYGLGRLLLKEDRRQEARDMLSRALQVIEGMRAKIRLDQLKDGFINNKTAVYETLVSLLVDLGETSEAFNTAERSRARNLIDLLGNQRLSLRGAVDQGLYDRQVKLKGKIREQEALLAQAEDDRERSVYGQALARLNDEYKDLMLEIQTKNPELASLVSVNPLTLSDVRALIEPGVALLAYYLIPGEVLCWLVRDESVELFRTPIGRETIDKSIMNYRRIIQNLEPFENQSKELYSWLLSRVMPGLVSGSAGQKDPGKPVRVLGIIPHGTLHYVSFATLYDGKDYPADRFSLFYLPSASVLRYTLERRKDRKSRRVLAIGNPDLRNQALDLPFAEREVATIGWNFPDITLLTRERATESWVVGHIHEFNIIHLASHGTFDPVNPLFSAVKLVKDIREDGDLEAAEVFGLRINADLVMLSACQTGLGKVTDGDDVIGMNRAFLYGGTHAIMSSLWRVSDISTAILVKQFYRRYVRENKSDSLRQAMLHVKNRYPHPGYWGAFVLVGDYY